MRDFADRLIAYETGGNNSSETKTPAACLVSEKLRPHLATLMGNVGFRALLSRALALANAEVPLTAAVRTSLLSCRKAGKKRVFTPVRESSGESRLSENANDRSETQIDDAGFRSRQQKNSSPDG